MRTSFLVSFAGLPALGVCVLSVSPLAVAVVELEEDAGPDIVIARAGGVTVHEDRKLGKCEPRELENAWPGEPAARVRPAGAPVHTSIRRAASLGGRP